MSINVWNWCWSHDLRSKWDVRLFTHVVYLITEGNDASKKNNSNHKIAEAMETDENGEESEERKTAIRICKTSKHNGITYNW